MHYPESIAMAPVHALHQRWLVLALTTAALASAPSAALAGQPDGDSGTSPPIPPVATTASGAWAVTHLHGADAANAVLMRAISLIGTPYVWGGATPGGGFDCSGLVNYVFRDMLDMRLPRTSRELAAAQGPRIDVPELQPGDLIFFGSDGLVSHVGIYVGEGRFIHAPRTGSVVRLEQIDTPYWLGRYSGARRVIDP